MGILITHHFQSLLLLNNIKIFQFLIFCAICLSFSLSQAYSISGTVLDLDSDNPIENVNIYIENSDIGTRTNNEGYFELYLNSQVSNSIDLNIKMIGYKQETLQINLLKSKINIDNIYLMHESLELESTHIHSHSNKSNQISDILLTEQELNDNFSGNIANTLSNQPNIAVNSFGIVTSKPVLRGYSGDRFLLTKDGNKSGDLSQSSIDHVITLDMTEVTEVEIIRGPKSLVYGSNAIGGVINASVSGDPKLRADKFYKKFFIGGQSFNKGLYGNMVLYIPIKNNQINILLSNSNTKNQSSPTMELENTYSQTSNYKMGFTTYNKNSYINFIIENFNMDYGIPPSSEGHINGVDIELIKNTFQINYHQDFSFYNFNQFDFKYNFIDYQHVEFENNSSSAQVFLSKNTHNFKIEFQSFSSIVGSEFSYNQFLPDELYYTPNTEELDFSLYGFHEKEFHHLDLLSSFRVGYLSIQPDTSSIQNISSLDIEEIKNRNFNYFSSSIGLRKFINKFEFNTWIMNTMKAPKIEELYSDGPHLGSYSYEIGEPNLELEKIYGIESSIAYNENPLDISFTTFYNYSPYYYQMSKIGECDGLTLQECLEAGFIEDGVGSGGWLYKYQTKGVKSLIKGIEFNLGYQYKKIKMIYNFSLVRGDDLTNKIPLSYINPDKQILNLEYDQKNISYKMRLSKIQSQNRLGEFETFTPSSFLVDFIIGYSKNNQNITIQFNNILDEESYNHLSKLKSIMPEPGRNITISYKRFF